jgi:O-antigen ligase
VPVLAGVLVLAALERPALLIRGSRLLDAALIAAFAGVLLQLVPLAPDLRQRLAPGAVAFDRALRVAAPIAMPPRPLSIDPDATRRVLPAFAASLAAFFVARSVLARSGVRTVARGVALLGLVLAPLTIVQHASSPRLFYWIWPPYAENARPYGPFVNRNDLATWLVLAIPLTVGYLLARLEAHRADDAGGKTAFADSTTVWLLGAAGLMTAALVASLSRSGLAGGAVGACVLAALSLRRASWRVGLSWLSGAAAAAVLVGAAYANVGALATKLDQAVSEGMVGRVSIWRQTWPMVRDFWQTGVGAGAYQTGMIPYQTSSHLFYINHAHNEYLQILAEGGVLLAVPAALAVLAGLSLAVRRVMEDRTPVFWMRAGALSGMIGLLTQSVWETTLRMPANTLLLAVVAAVALHPTHPRRGG